MTKVHLPLGSYRDSQSDRIDEGRYTVRVEDADVQKSKSGNLMVVTWLKVIGGTFDGATLVDRMTISEAALFRIVGFMRAIKLPTPKRDLDIDTRVFVGRVLDVDVVDNEYRGSVSSQVGGYMVASNLPDKAEEPDLDDLEPVGDEPEEPAESGSEDSGDEYVPTAEDIKKAKKDTKDIEKGLERDPEILDLDSIEF